MTEDIPCWAAKNLELLTYKSYISLRFPRGHGVDKLRKKGLLNPDSVCVRITSSSMSAKAYSSNNTFIVKIKKDGIA